jgi:hypothetical protein
MRPGATTQAAEHCCAALPYTAVLPTTRISLNLMHMD